MWGIILLKLPCTQKKNSKIANGETLAFSYWVPNQMELLLKQRWDLLLFALVGQNG
jgi:hypothetical protein